MNVNQRTHWSHRQRVTKAWREMTYLDARRAGLPHLERARIVATYRFHDRRRRDPANFFTTKAIVDGLIDFGLLPDDDYRHLIGPDLRIGEPVPKGQPLSVVLTIHDLRNEPKGTK